MKHFRWRTFYDCSRFSCCLWRNPGTSSFHLNLLRICDVRYGIVLDRRFWLVEFVRFPNSNNQSLRLDPAMNKQHWMYLYHVVTSHTSLTDMTSTFLIFAIVLSPSTCDVTVWLRILRRSTWVSNNDVFFNRLMTSACCERSFRRASLEFDAKSKRKAPSLMT